MITRPNVHPSPDVPIVTFKEDQASVDLEKILPQTIEHHGFPLGTLFHVMFTDRVGENLLNWAQFVVTKASDGIKMVEQPDGGMSTKNDNTREFKQLTPWFAEEAEDEDGLYRKWIPKLQIHEVRVKGTDVVVGTHLNQDAADAMVAGELPLEMAA